MKHLSVRFLLFASAFLASALPPADPFLLEQGKTIERELAGGQSHEYGLSLEAGQYARLHLFQRNINVSVTCLGPDNQKRFEVDGQWIGDTEILELIADGSGVYRFLVTAPDKHAPPGRYNIAIHAVEGATETHRNRVAGSRAYAQGKAAYQALVREALLKAVAGFEEAVKYWRAAQDPAEESRALSDMGMMYIQLGDQRKAMECANQALSLARSVRNRQMEASAISTLGVIQNNFGDKKTAIEYFDQVLILNRELKDRASEANTLNYLGRAHFRSGQNRKALVYLQEALQVVREVQDRTLEAYVLADIGSVNYLLGEYRQALESHQQSLALEREMEDHGAEAVALNNIGLVYLNLGEYQRALDSYLASAELQRKQDPRGDRLAVSLENIGLTYTRLGDRERALPYFQEALSLLRVVNNRTALADTLNSMGSNYSEAGDSRRALELHTEALALRRSTNDADGEAVALSNLGVEHGKLGEWEKAREHQERALEILRKSGNRGRLAAVLRALGMAYGKTGNRDRALASLQEALEISRAIRDRQGEASSLAGIARVERDSGNFARAEATASEALEVFESVRRTIMSPNLRASFLASVQDLQELDLELLMRLHEERPNEGFGGAALFSSERSRARSLLELLQESGAEIRRGVDLSLIQREQDLARRISAKADAQVRMLSRTHTDSEADALARELKDFSGELDQVQSRIRSTSPQYAALTQPAPLNLKEIQTMVLDSDTVLLEYALGKDKSFLWVVGPASIDVVGLPPRAEIESAVKRVHELLTARNQRPEKETPAERTARIRRADQAYMPAAMQASRILLGPAAARMEKKRLLIVAEGVLLYLPFGALPEPLPDGSFDASPQPLIANHEIVSAPSASVVSVLRNETAGRAAAPKTVAVFADPVFGRGDARVAQRQTLAPDPVSGNAPGQIRRSATDPASQEFLRLRFSRTEAEEILRLAPPGTALRALDFEASRDAVLQPELGQYRIVHFATHSVLNSEHPELSGVVFSLINRSGQRQNGFLRLYDIYNLRLASDLVVLSACRTALGGEVRGEGLIGLTRGFLYAGARRVVASLWEIDDRATAELMKRFYEGILSRGERPAAALKAAQAAMYKTKGWDTPYYWAAFTLQGEWR